MTTRYHVNNGVAVLEMARPEKKNALTQEMYAGLAAGLESAAADDSVRAIIITGHSDRLEGSSTELSEARAKAVRDYLVSQGLDQKLMFWEGRGSKQPVPVTKFCSS